MDSKTIGERLQRLRSDRPRERVAKDLGVSLSAMAMYERGERIPRDEIKIRIARYYGKTVQDIFYA